MRRVIPLSLATCLIGLAASPALAQKQTVTTTSWFTMFLWTDDILGLLNIWILVLFSAVSLAWTIHLMIQYRRSVMIPEESQQQIDAMLVEKRYREAIEFANNDPSYLCKVVSSGLNEASNGFSAMERALEETSDAETTRMLRPIEYLNVLGNISPMLGLFGTVYGMIIAFYKLVETGGKPDPAQLAAGISTALVTTFWGLVVAIPTLTAYALIRNHVDTVTTDALIMAEELIKPFKPAGKKTQPGTQTASPGKPRATPKPSEMG